MTAESDASTPQGDGAAEQQTPRGAQGSTVAPSVLSTPDQAPSTPRPPSPLRNRANWVTYVTLPLVGALALWIIQGGWGWVWDQVTGPPESTVYTPGVSSFSSYTDLPVDAVKKNYESAAKEGVPVATKDNYPPRTTADVADKDVAGHRRHRSEDPGPVQAVAPELRACHRRTVERRAPSTHPHLRRGLHAISANAGLPERQGQGPPVRG